MTGTCTYCDQAILKVRVPDGLGGGRRWRWQSDKGSFYCPKAGGDCWHEPKAAPTPEKPQQESEER